MLIGEVADTLGVGSQTIRFYERRGLLLPPHREPNGYRRYDPGVLGRLRFIQSGQAAGLTLAEIASILSLRDAGQAPCTHVSDLLALKLEDVRARQRELSALASELEDILQNSRDLDPADCTEADICSIIAKPEGVNDDVVTA